MTKKKLKTYEVTLHGTLPCTAYLVIDAEDESSARQAALENYQDADWCGSDYSVPERYSVEIGDVSKS